VYIVLASLSTTTSTKMPRTGIPLILRVFLEKEEHYMQIGKKALKALHDVIATCYDAAEGFGKAAKGVHGQALSDWLAAASGQSHAGRCGLE
jgi:hypothetical protein